jgi:predicted small metal-binding protein
LDVNRVGAGKEIECKRYVCAPRDGVPDMFANKPLRCECGYEVQASDEAARVEEVQRHASEAHGIDLSADVALNVVRRVRPVPCNEQRREE